MRRAILAAGLVFLSPLARAAGPPPDEAALDSAIRSLRGVRVEGMTDAAKREVGTRLDAAWDVLLAAPERARPKVEAVLDGETADEFLILDLAHLHLGLTKGKSDRARLVAWVLKADPNANPSAFWKIAGLMASERCAACRPVIVKAASLRTLDPYIQQHALKVDLELGLMFLWGSYGDDLSPELDRLLESGACAERGNAALGLGLLRAHPPAEAMRKVAGADPCPSARVRAWRGLSLANDAGVAAAATRRLSAPPPPAPDERWAMIDALTSTADPGVRAPLAALAKDSDPDIAADARRGIEELDRGLRELPGLDSDPARRARLLAALEAAAAEGRLEGLDERAAAYGAARPEDVPLLVRARRAVLRRFSDECLYEFRTLSSLLFLARSRPVGKTP